MGEDSDDILTRQSFDILDIFLADKSRKPISGRDLRARLRALKIRRSGPAFYQHMSRLEEQGLVKGRYMQKDVHGQKVREREYTLTGLGQRALSRTATYYLASNTVVALKPELLSGLILGGGSNG